MFKKEKIYLYFAVVFSASHRGLHCLQQRAMQRLRYFRLRIAAVFDVGRIGALVFVALVARSTALMLSPLHLFLQESMGCWERLLHCL